MRKYQPIWNELKKHNEASLVAPPDLHPRIIQAVRKERSKDAGWRYLLAEKGKKYTLKIQIDGTTLVLSLEELIPITPIGLEDL